MTPLEFLLFVMAVVALVGAVFFYGGRTWERAGWLEAGTGTDDDDAGWLEAGTGTDDDAADSIAGWARGLREDAPAAPTLALVHPPLALPAPLATVPPRGPERHYSALEAWRLEHDTRRDADTSVTKLEAYVVAGMVCRDQIDARAAVILAQARRALTGDVAA
jgi:hypothetical protein